MKKIFLNLSTRNKLLAGFMSVLLVTLIVEYNEYHNLSRFSKIHSVIVEANQTRSSIKDLK
ncbi:MAG: hypothetical protein RIS47_1221, partial [Bacteroidota bacterium]